MSWYDPRNPSQLQSEPWLAPKIIDRLESILHPDFEVMEFGGGGSTLWFAERVRRVVCYENNLEWYTALDNKNLDNVVLQFGSFPLEEETDKDLLLIDGEPVRLRAGWLREAQRIVKRGGWIILDNANRREYARERADMSAFAVLEYQSELVGKHLITEIWKVL